jgi:pilus assembly protein Flp/PilA
MEAPIAMKTRLLHFLRDEAGLTTVEYAIAGGLIGVALVAAFPALGLSVAASIVRIAALLP